MAAFFVDNPWRKLRIEIAKLDPLEEYMLRKYVHIHHDLPLSELDPVE